MLALKRSLCDGYTGATVLASSRRILFLAWMPNMIEHQEGIVP
jgi:hypothetical protein